MRQILFLTFLVTFAAHIENNMAHSLLKRGERVVFQTFDQKTYTYTLISDGMPSEAQIVIADKAYRGVNAQGNVTLNVSALLTAEDVKVICPEGYTATVAVDNSNFQINVTFKAKVLVNQEQFGAAVTLFSRPGKEFMHKLVPLNGDTIERVDLGTLSSLQLKEDRLKVGNKYLYIHGTAPDIEGVYTYYIYIRKKNVSKTCVPITLIVSNDLQSPTPIMAWLSWNWFARELSHDKLLDVTKGMEKYGLIEAGYQTIVLDDCWAIPQQNKALLNYDANKFPQGIRGFVNACKKVNPKVKIGIYSDAGKMTCEWYQPGSYQYEEQHLSLFDSWGVDLLKYDYCNSETDTWNSYKPMGDAIKALNAKRKKEGRNPFVFNICEWGKTKPWLWGAEAGGSYWRVTSDVRECWVGNGAFPGVLAAVDEVRDLWMYAGVNRFNDLDMMCIGLHGLGGPSNYTLENRKGGGIVKGLTNEQARSQMSLWCMMASPLSLTADLRESPKAEANPFVLPKYLITNEDIKTLTNSALIAINQDPLGQQAEYLPHLSTGREDYSEEGYDVYVKDLVNGRKAIAIVNRSKEVLPSMTFNLIDFYLNPSQTYRFINPWNGTTHSFTTKLRTGAFAAYETKVFIME